MSDLIISQSLNYKNAQAVAPSYKHQVLIAREGASNFNLSNSQTQMTFELQSGEPFNLSQSVLRFDIELGAQIVGETKYHGYLYRDALAMIDNIEFYTSQGVKMCDFNNYFSQYTKSVLKQTTKLDDFLNCDQGVLIRGNAATNVNERYNGDDTSIAYTENRYFVASANVNTAVSVNYKINLSELKHSILSLDKDLWFPSITYLRVTFANKTNVGWKQDGNTISELVPGVAVTLSNLKLYLAKETNQGIIDDFNSKQMMPPVIFDSVRVDKLNKSGSNHTVSVQYGAGDGLSLKKVMFSVYPEAEEKAQRYLTLNDDGSLITSFRTLINNNRLYQFDIDCKAGEDYLVLKNSLKNSVIQSKEVHEYNWFWCDNFGPEIQAEDLPKYANSSSGLPLTGQPVKWDMYATMAANAVKNHYVFAVCQRMLSSSNSGIMVN